jgi:ABC-type Mn2+/Zn2+ transport system ATPase subunit
MMGSLLHHPPHHLPDAPSLELEQVSVAFGRTQALDRVSLRLKRADRVAVVGPNGAGKSTLFNVIAGVVRPDAGEVRVYGSSPGGHICVGYVPQRNGIDWSFPVTVSDVVMMGRVGRIGPVRWPGRDDRRIVQEAIERVALAGLARRQIGELSGGQQQRVFLARALAQEAELLLMDEPLTGLDAPSQEGILGLLDELNGQGVTILVATHDLQQAAEHFPLAALLNRRLIAFGPPRAVLTPGHLAAAFGSHVHVLRTDEGDVMVTDNCCGGGELPPEVTVGRPPDAAVALPEREVRVDGERSRTHS